MANEEQVKILKQGVKVWNKWREENLFTKIDLSQADLREADLRKVNLRKADLRVANFMGADLRRANLSGAELSIANFMRANLSGAELAEANLKYAILWDADLRHAILWEANLIETNLIEANFSKASIAGTVFGNTDLGEAIGLQDMEHLGPSTLGIDTIALSKGRIPEAFLRGCGLNDLQIEMAKLVTPGLDPEQVTEITYKMHRLYLGGGIQYYSCFISYSSKDQEFAQRLHDDLQNNGVRCWFAPEDMKIGDQIRPTIDRQIRLRDKLLIILSGNSIKSEWVGDEVEGALEEESKSNRLVLFPIRLDDTVLNTRDDWAAKIKRRRHIGDFSNWKDKSSYRKAFERLMRDLKATGDKSAVEGDIN